MKLSIGKNIETWIVIGWFLKLDPLRNYFIENIEVFSFLVLSRDDKI